MNLYSRFACLAAIFFLIPVNVTQAENMKDGPFDIRFQNVTTDIVLAFRENPTRYPVIGNVVIIFNKDHVILVDTGRVPTAAHQVLAKIKERPNGRLRTIILTHWHGDHSEALFPYLQAYPDVEIIAHSWTAGRMKSSFPISFDTYGDQMKANAEVFLQALKSGKEASGRLLEPGEVSYYRQFEKDLPAILKEYETYSARDVVLPTMIVNKELLLRSETRDVVIQWLGQANTPGDLTIYIPADDVLIVGDIVTYPIPFGFSRNPSEWVKVLKRVIQMKPKTIIPGHGPILSGTEYVQRVHDLFENTIQQVQLMNDQDMTLEQIAGRVDYNPFLNWLSSNHPEMSGLFVRWYKTPVVENILNELNQ